MAALIRMRRLPFRLLVAIVSLLISCNRHNPTIAFIPETTAEGVWEPAHVSSANIAKELGYRLYWNAPGNPDDVRAQIELLRQVSTRKYDGLILAPDHFLALMTSVSDYVRRGIPTVIVGSPLPLVPHKGLSYVLNDEAEEGRIAAQRIGTQLHGTGTIAILGATPDIQSTLDRITSFERELHSAYPKVSIVERELNSYSEMQSSQMVQELLHLHPDLGAIFALTSNTTEGAFYALDGLGQKRSVLLIGCGQQFRLLYYLSRGRIDSIIAENTYEMGSIAVRTIEAERRGNAIDRVIHIAPVLITKDNLYSPEFKNMLTRDHRTAR